MYDYDPQLLLPAPEENVSEKHLVMIPTGALIANRPLKRRGSQSFKAYWKARRNANIALKVRLRQGPLSAVQLDPETMDVVTQREQIVRDKHRSMAPVEVKKKVDKGPWKRKTRKGLKLAGGR